MINLKIQELKSKKMKSKTENHKEYSKVNAVNNDFDKAEYDLLLDEKESKIQEYLEIINAKDTQLLSQRLCCPVCITDLNENRKMIAFYK